MILWQAFALLSFGLVIVAISAITMLEHTGLFCMRVFDLGISTMLLPTFSQGVGKLGPLSNLRTIFVGQVDWDHDYDGYASQDGRSILQWSTWDLLVQGSGIHGRDTSQEVSCETVTSSSRSRVRTVGCHHVVDGREVDCIIGNGDHDGEDHRSDPVYLRWSQGSPSETEQTKRFQWSQPKKKLESLFRKDCVAAFGSSNLPLPMNIGQEDEEGEQISNVDGDIGHSDLTDTETPLSVDVLESFQEGEDEGIGETREERHGEYNWLSNKHLKGSNDVVSEFPECESIFLEFVGSIDVALASLPSPLGFLIQHTCSSRFRNGKEVDDLDCKTKDELDVEDPSVRSVLLDEATNDWPNRGTAYRRQDDVGDGILMSIDVVQVGYHSQSDGSSSGRNTT